MNVYITRAATFLPNDPVSNDDMESRLGMIGGHPSKARKIVLRRNGIKQRYYALDAEGNVTHTNAQLAANSIRALCGNGFDLADIDVLSCGTASPDQLIPSHGVMVHGELKEMRSTEVVSFAGSCCAGAHALKYAAMSVALDPDINAVASASERLSAWLKAAFFKEESGLLERLKRLPMLAFEKDFLRWMLSDGASSVLLQGRPNADGPSLRVEWIELTSFANIRETCMCAGAEKDSEGRLLGWTMFPEEEWLTRSLFAVKQDVRLLSENIVTLGLDFLLQLSQKNGLKAEDVDWFLPHLSSMFFKEKILEESKARGFFIPEDKWFVNLPRVGNIATASGFSMIDELMRSGRLEKGQKILMMIPESARFSYCYALFTVC